MRTAKRAMNGEGTLRLRADGRWEKKVMVDGRLKSFFGKTPAVANKKWRDWLKERAEADAGGAGDAMTVGELVERFIDKELPKRRPAPRTLENYRWSASHIVPALGSKPLRGPGALSVDDVDDLLEAKVKTHARTSVSRLRSHLVEVINYGIARDHADRNVAAVTRVPQGREREGRAMTPSEAARFVAAIEGHRLEALYLLDMMALTRPGEGLGIRWDDLELDDTGAALQVRQMLKLLPGSQLTLGEVKTKKSARGIDLADRVRIALLKRREMQDLERALAGASWQRAMPDPITGEPVANTLVFTTRTGGPISHGYVRRKLKEITDSIGLGSDWTTYDLRTTGASLLVDAGVPLESVADLMGHTTIRMLETRYRKRVRPTNAVAVAPMQELFG